MSLLDGIEEEASDSKKEDAEEEISIDQSAITIVCDDETRRVITTGVKSEYNLIVKNGNENKEAIEISVDLIPATSLGEDAAEWSVTLQEKGGKTVDVPKNGLKGKDIELAGNETASLQLTVTSPRGARYGDTMNVITTVTSVQNPAISDSITLRTTAQQSVLAVKTQIGHERTVADTLSNRSKDLGVQSILCPASLRGYIVVEAMNTDRLSETVRSIKRARGLVDGEMKFDEINHYLTPKPLVSGIVEGDIVELIAGPFKGEKARVQLIDEGKEEITVELFEALVPIPVTIKGDNVRVIEKDR